MIHATLTVRTCDIYKYNEHKVARQLGERLGNFIGGECYQKRAEVGYLFRYTTKYLTQESKTHTKELEGIHTPPIPEGADYLQFTLTLIPISLLKVDVVSYVPDL